jgi:peptidyl-prolyl cis-trans isomerase B (cyclophilin B)
MARVPGAAFAVVLAAALAGCGGSSTKSSTPPPPPPPTSQGTGSGGCSQVSAPKSRTESRKAPGKPLDASKKWTATVETSCGSFTISLDVKGSPNTTASFVSLARSGFYEDTTFHRVVPGFVIQGGDPTATGAGGPGYSVVDTPPRTTTYPIGSVAMAKTRSEPPGTSGSQFFVVIGENTGLTPDYALLGKVVQGMSVVDTIGKLGDPSDPNGTPTQVVVIHRITISTS